MKLGATETRAIKKIQEIDSIVLKIIKSILREDNVLFGRYKTYF